MKKELNIDIKKRVDDDFEKSYDKYIESGRHTVDVLEDNSHKEIYGSGFADGIRAATKLYDEVMTYIMMNDITYPNFILGYVNKTTKALNDILTLI